MATETAYESFNGDLEELVKVKARELFAVCDKENKGFINKVDMQRLHGELSLTDDQLRDVFDSLDVDGNGYLTFDEFCDGFGGFLGSQSEAVEDTSNAQHDVVGDVTEEFSEDMSQLEKSGREGFSDSHLRSTIHRLLSNYSLDESNEQEILDICHRMYEERDLSSTIEDFIHLVVHDLNTAKNEKLALERLLKERSTTHEDEVRQLYEEMERQINEERQINIHDEVQRERAVSQSLQNRLQQKEQQLVDVSQRQSSLEEEIAYLSTDKHEVKSENSQLVQLNQSLMEELHSTQQDLEKTRLHMATIQHQKERQEEKQRAEEEARKLDLEKKSLIKQLEMLREVNRKLRDDKDEAVQRTQNSPAMTGKQTSTPKHRPLFTQGSNVGKYFPNDSALGISESIPSAPPIIEECEDEWDQIGTDSAVVAQNVHSLHQEEQVSTSSSDSYSSSEGESGKPSPSRNRKSRRSDRFNQRESKRSFRRERTRAEGEPGLNGQNGEIHRISSSRKLEKEKRARARFYRKLSKNPHSDASSEGGSDNPESVDDRFHPRIETDGREIVSDATNAATAPDRVYKIVFVGNSGVGKTSLIQQFVSSTFVPSHSATIGVDYQVKTLTVDGQLIALQLWDTAGQERYRSITRQYFRKADGVVVVYNVTDEKSFLAVRNWMQSVQEGADPNVVIILLGNKSDVANNGTRQVTPKEGAKLAEEYCAKFFETSAKSGSNIQSSMTVFASDLTRLEDEQRESVLSLAASDEELKRSTCCSGLKLSK